MREYIEKALEMAKEIEKLQRDLQEKQQELRYLIHSCDGALNAKELLEVKAKTGYYVIEFDAEESKKEENNGL